MRETSVGELAKLAQLAKLAWRQELALSPLQKSVFRRNFLIRCRVRIHLWLREVLGEQYVDKGMEYYEQRHREQQIRSLLKRAQKAWFPISYPKDRLKVSGEKL